MWSRTCWPLFGSSSRGAIRRICATISSACMKTSMPAALRTAGVMRSSLRIRRSTFWRPCLAIYDARLHLQEQPGAVAIHVADEGDVEGPGWVAGIYRPVARAQGAGAAVVADPAVPR